MFLEQLIPFIGNHPILIMIWLAFFFGLLFLGSVQSGKKLSPQQVTAKINNENAVILDIRKRDEFNTGHLPDAINIAFENLESRKEELEKYKDRPIIVICKTGTTAGSAGALLTKAGFANVFRMSGGILDWQAQKLPLVK